MAIKPVRKYAYKTRGRVIKIAKLDYTDNWTYLSREVKSRDGNRCSLCGSTDRLEVHHIIPLSKGGSNSKRNLITLCYSCHNVKHRNNPSMVKRSKHHA